MRLGVDTGSDGGYLGTMTNIHEAIEVAVGVVAGGFGVIALLCTASDW